MRNTYSLQFYCRNSKATKNGLAPIELSIIINGKRVFINLPRKEYPATFKKAVESKRNNPIKQYLDEVRNKFNDIQLDMLRNSIPLSASALKDYFRTGGVKAYTIEEAFEEYRKLLEKRVGVDLTELSYRKYNESFTTFFNYVDKTKELTTITPAVMEGFLVDCNSKYKTSTVAGIMTRVKTVIKYHMNNNRLTINPLQSIKYSKGRKEIEYLTDDEINTLYDLKIDNESLDNIRDAFILQASTGLAYIDIKNLQKEDIQIAEDGTHYIIKNRCKTNTKYTTIILDKGVQILKKHNYNLHIVSNQKYNYMLKLLQKISGIEHNLTTHLARKTFGTHLINTGVRLEVVSRAMGHKSTRITQSSYAELLNNTVIDELKAAN